MTIEMPRVAAHPNRLPFRGVLTLVDTPSERTPAGARGHRVLLTREAAERALPSLLGMGLDYTPSLDAHDARRKVGVITAAEIVPSTEYRVPSASNSQLGTRYSQLVVEGYLFAKDFPDVVRELRAAGKSLGMSYEVADAKVEDTGARVWVLTEVTFTGAAVLKKSKAAYSGTSIEIDAVSTTPLKGHAEEPRGPAAPTRRGIGDEAPRFSDLNTKMLRRGSAAEESAASRRSSA